MMRIWCMIRCARQEAEMIEVIESLPANVLGVRNKGRVTVEDYKRVLIPAAKAALRQHDKIRLYDELGNKFEGNEAGAVFEDLKVGIRKLPRCEQLAIVTDVKWIKQAVSAFASLIHGMVKGFPVSEVLLQLRLIWECRCEVRAMTAATKQPVRRARRTRSSSRRRTVPGRGYHWRSGSPRARFASLGGQLVKSVLGNGEISRFLDEGLLILGWVANWRPIEIFFDDWWPLARRRRLFRRLAPEDFDWQERLQFRQLIMLPILQSRQIFP
jgi:hypothetical protein